MSALLKMMAEIKSDVEGRQANLAGRDCGRGRGMTRDIREWLKEVAGSAQAWLIPLDAVAIVMVSDEAVHVTLTTGDSYSNIPVDRVKIIEINGKLWMAVV